MGVEKMEATRIYVNIYELNPNGGNGGLNTAER